MIKNNKVSIIIPVYNAENTILRSLCSVQEQTYKNIEIIIIDDGSEDHTYELCLKIAESDNRIILTKQSNQGVSCARNKGISLSSGDYIVFVDSDDLLPTNGIELLVAGISNNNNFLICGSFAMLKKFGRKKLFLLKNKTFSEKKYQDNIYYITSIIPYAPWGKLFLTRIIKEKNILFPKGIPYGEDGIFLLNYLRYIDKIIFIDEIVYNYYLVNSYSLSNTYHKDMNKFLKFLSDEREKTCETICNNNYEKEIQLEYFKRSVRYYIIHEKNKSTLERKLLETILLFPKAILSHQENEMLIHRNLKCFVAKWKFKHIGFYLKELAKFYIHALFGVRN